jgi:hypothetical protein
MPQASAKQMVLGAIFNGFMAGALTVFGIWNLTKHGAALTGLAFLALAIGFCVVAVNYGRKLMKVIPHH